MALEDTVHSLLAGYMRAPQWLRSAAGVAYRGLPKRVKYGARYARFEAEARLGHTVPAALVEQRLRAGLNDALTHVPAYRAFHGLLRQDRSAFEVLRALPTVSKPELKQRIERYLSTRVPPARRLRMFTGGSTATPMLFYLERHTTRARESAYIDVVDRDLLGAGADDWTLSLRGRNVRTASDGGLQWVREPIKRHVILSSDHLEQRWMPGYAELLRQLRPRLIHAFPSALYPLARWLAEHPLPEFTAHVKGVLLTSENVYDFQLELFRRVFGRRVLAHYGHSERVLMAVAGAQDACYRFFPLYGVPEILNPAGQVIDRPGVVGEITGTSFDNAALPFVRYRTGDVGMWEQAPAQDGQVQWVMRKIEGRLQEFVVCRDQRLVSITTLGAAHFDQLAAVENIQFEQAVPGLLRLKVVSAQALSGDQCYSIAQAVERKTQGGCAVQIEQVAAIERTARGKQCMLIQHIDLERYFGASITPDAQETLVSN